MAECNPDDVICQMEVLRHLQGLERQLGSELFLEKYPEAAPLRDKIARAMITQGNRVSQELASCATAELEADSENIEDDDE